MAIMPNCLNRIRMEISVVGFTHFTDAGNIENISDLVIGMH